MAEAKKARMVGFNHVALEVGDIEEALAFYGRLFQFELRGKSETMAFIDLGDQFIALQKGRLQGDHRSIGSHPGGERGGVGAIELSQGDAVERHLGVVRRRLQLPGRLLQDRAMAFGWSLGHRRSSQRSRPGTPVRRAARTPAGPPGPGYRPGPAPRIETLGEVNAQHAVPVTVLL